MNLSKITDYLYDCRWCNFKEDIRQGNVNDVILEPMPYDNGNKLFVIGTAAMNNGAKRYFSMPLAEKAAMPNDRNVIIMNGKIYTDALLEPDFWKTLMTFVEENNGMIKFSNGWTLERQNIGDQSAVENAINEDSYPLGVEQSNTTLKVGDCKLAFKLERMLEFSHEVNSELEMNEKLMRENCSVMPKSYGGLVWRKPDGEQASFGIMQEFVKNKGDMWGYLLDYLDEKLSEGYLHQRNLTAEDNPEFMQIIRNLSQKTQEMGECFARPDENPNFAPEKVDEGFIRKYEKQMTVLLHKTKRQIEQNLDRLPEPAHTQAENILANWDETTDALTKGRFEALRNADDKGTINRVHGDFHLGQVMVTPDNDLRFIDFAGEPDLPMTERKQKHIYVRDVAGMYRSIKGYLGAVAVENFAAKAPNEVVALERKTWAQKAIKPLIEHASQAFLGNKSVQEPWLNLEILRKNLYEVNYEVGNRPAMAYVPIEGLNELFGMAPQPANEALLSQAKTGTEHE